MTRTAEGVSVHTWQHVRRVLSTSLVTLFCTLAVLLVALALFTRDDGTGVTRIGDRPVLTVLSDSMTPTFRAGDLLIADAVTDASKEIGVGDIITFRTGADDQLVSHRVVAVRHLAGGGVAYQTKGDANNAPDATPVAPDHVVGTYATRIPFAGYALAAAQSRTAVFVLLFVALMVLVLPLFAKWWRDGDGSPGREDATEVEAASAHGGQRGGER